MTRLAITEDIGAAEFLINSGPLLGHAKDGVNATSDMRGAASDVAGKVDRNIQSMVEDYC